MKLIHCADVHLDSALKTHLTPEKARERRAELLDDFCSLPDYAQRNGVSAILIAGDLFDIPHPTKRTLNRVREAISSHPDIVFFYLPGNHDLTVSLWEKGSEPGNLHVFGAEWQTVPLGEVTVSGSTVPDAASLSLDPAALNIVLLHGTAVTSAAKPENDEFPIPAFANRGIDYLALGHIHKRQSVPCDRFDGRCTARYCGCLGGRGFDECGEKGFLLLETLPGKRIASEFVPWGKRTLRSVPVDLTGCDSQSEAGTRALAAVVDLPAQDLIRVVLTGELDPSFSPDAVLIERNLAGRFWFVQVRDETRLAIHPEDYRHDISLKGEFIRLVLASELDEAQKNRVIGCGLRALYGEDPGL